MPPLALEQSDLGLQVLDFLGQELDQVFEVLPLLVELVLLGNVVVFLA